MGTMINLTSADGTTIPAYEARPIAAPKGAVVLLQEIFGLNSHIRAVADGYAQDGYYVIAPATFQRAEPGVELGYSPEDMQRGFGLKTAAEAVKPQLMQDVQAAIDHAAKFGKVGVMGYCWGGLLTWRAATQLTGVSAAVPYYGGGMHLELAHAPRCPTMAHLSNDDAYVPMDGVAALQKAHPGVQVLLYAAKHGFNCDQRASWHPESAALARQRTLAFFAQHLAG
ncbi:MAG: dienelactone hydrolase family protein [Burkholderiaceae bacterium]